ncbi:hypothetical protein F5B19DRAFT_166486 [Rostrohypoxylon terebratum]|nr:hypothetical protein F5B19DRAFT_166486 [Rostrohypoxylon terebratum]
MKKYSSTRQNDRPSFFLLLVTTAVPSPLFRQEVHVHVQILTKHPSLSLDLHHSHFASLSPQILADAPSRLSDDRRLLVSPFSCPLGTLDTQGLFLFIAIIQLVVRSVLLLCTQLRLQCHAMSWLSRGGGWSEANSSLESPLLEVVSASANLDRCDLIGMPVHKVSEAARRSAGLDLETFLQPTFLVPTHKHFLDDRCTERSQEQPDQELELSS